ncbi:MAG: TIGR02444 family protein [Bermanella sp.]
MVQVAHDAINSLDNPFWLYSIEQYKKPGCAEFLLDAQDHFQLDINILLFIGWLISQNKVYREDVALNDVHLWQLSKVKPIRKLRRQVKQLQNKELYQAFKDLELMAEQKQQKMLFLISQQWPESNNTRLEGFKVSMNKYGRQKGITMKQSWLQALYQHLQP